MATLSVFAAGSVAAQKYVAITPVTIVDVTDGSLHPDQTVVVEGDRIAAVKPVDEVAVPNAAAVVDGTNRYLIPGLWDMHVHLFNQITQRPPNLWYLPLLVANGVTGVREMWAKPADAPRLAEWRERIEAGALLGPRIGAAGALVDGGRPWWPTADRVTTAEQARRFVGEVDRAGLDFVKVYSSLSREVYFAILDESRRVGLPVAGHIPLVLRAEEAAAEGQRSNEHLHQIREGCSARERTILEERTRLYSGDFTAAEDDSLWERHERMRVETYDSGACELLAHRLASAGLWQVPTLVNERGYFLGAPEGAERDPRLAYVPSEERRVWKRGLQEHGVEISTSSQARPDENARRWAATLEVVRVLAGAGVPFLAGTDLGSPFLYPGFSLHEELELLVEAGLTPLEALQAATLNPARYLEATDSLGTVEPGKLADLVLLEANPLEDIANTRKIAAVVLNGRYLDRQALDGLLSQAQRTAAQQPVRAREVHASTLTIDTHAGFSGDPLQSCRTLPRQVDLPKMKAGGLDAVFFTVYAAQAARHPEEYARAQERARTVFARIHHLAETCAEQIALAYAPEDVERIVASGKLAVAIGIENGFVIGTDLSLLAKYRDLGASYFGLTHIGHNDIADSSEPREELGDLKREHGGLSDFGRRVVAELNRLGIMVDVSHASNAAAREAMRLSRAPVIASHSSVQALAGHPRNMDDETLLALKENGGVIQITPVHWFLVNEPPEATEAAIRLWREFGVEHYGDVLTLPAAERAEFERRNAELEERWPLATVSNLVDHIDYVVRLIGIDHVGIGSDFDGGGGISGWMDASETAHVTAELLRRGYTEEEIRKIWGGNLLRVWREARAVGAARRP